MNIERDYLKFSGEFSLVLLAMSAGYFLQVSKPVTFLALLPVTVLFGYTAYISRHGFQTPSLLGLAALLFAALNFKMVSLAILVAVGNILVSLLGGGERFRDYYSTTTIPMVLAGTLIGAAVFLNATGQPDFADTVRTGTAEMMGEQTESLVKDSGMLQQQKSVQTEIVEKTSAATVEATTIYVLNDTRKELDQEELLVLQDSFESAQGELPERITEKTEDQMESTDVDISAAIKKVIDSNMKGKFFLVFVPLFAVLASTIQPIVGLLTAFFAKVFASLDG